MTKNKFLQEHFLKGFHWKVCFIIPLLKETWDDERSEDHDKAEAAEDDKDYDSSKDKPRNMVGERGIDSVFESKCRYALSA